MKTGLYFILLSLLSISCTNESEMDDSNDSVDSTEVQLHQRATSLFGALPDGLEYGSDKTVLGRELYFEKKLSINNEISCNSCHMLDKYGVDNLAVSPGHDGKVGERNSPSVYNAVFHLAQFWDGRAMDLVEQAKGPITNPIEMGMASDLDAVKKIAEEEGYKELFSKVYGDTEEAVSFDNIADAIAEYEKTLVTPSRFDSYIAGDFSALTSEEKEGMVEFIDAGCITCHAGNTFGGKMYQKFGLINGPYWDYTGSERQDRGRAEVTGNDSEEYFFKVPSLRNVEKTSPYFHDGSVAELSKAVEIISITQTGKELTPEQVDKIVTFLKALTGDIPEHANEPKEMASAE
ncbi:MAG: cytochrome-c peroxidase [Candidatus Kapaibacteriales bacterium]